MTSTKCLFLLNNYTQLLRKDSETFGSEGNKKKKLITYRGNILCQASLEKMNWNGRRLSLAPSWEHGRCVIVSPWWKASHLMVTPLFRRPTMQAEKSQLVTTREPHQGVFSQVNNETWEHLRWSKISLEESISQRDTSEFNIVVPKEVLIL